MIEEALVQARNERESLHKRLTQLDAEIAEAEAALSENPSRSGGQESLMPLHEAIEKVLRDNQNRGMSARSLADEINRSGLYRKRDGSILEANQIHARTHNRADLFEKDGANIRLKESPMLADLPASIKLFIDDEDGFFGWVDSHPDGYFINTYRNPSPKYLVLHRSGQCGHFKGGPPAALPTRYIKLCSPQREDLDAWARQAWRDEEDPAEVTLCGSCFR